MDEDSIIIEIQLRNYARTQQQMKQIASLAKSIPKSVGPTYGGAGGGRSYNYQNFQQSVHYVQVYNQQINRASRATNSAVVSIQKLARAAGIEGPLIAALGDPVTAVVAGLVAAGLALEKMTSDAMEAGASFRKIALTSGGTRAETSQLATLGNALGVDMGQAARQFAEEISHGGVAGGFAARAGIHDYGIFDTTDKAGKLLDMLKYLDKLSDPEAKRAARATGTEALLPYKYLNDSTKHNLIQTDPMFKSAVMTDKTVKDFAELQFATARLADSFTNLEVALVERFIVPITPVIDGVTTAFQLFSASLSNNIKVTDGASLALRGIYESLAAQMTNDVDLMAQAARDQAAGFGKMMEGTNARETALDRNTRALEDNTQAFATRNGTYGGGERAHGATPSKWSGVNSERYLSEARRLGAFNL